MTGVTDQVRAVVDVTMPKLSDSMEEATVLAWLKRPGDTVAKGEPLVEVETDKATIVYEAELAGVLTEIVVDEGGSAELGAVIARIETAGGAVPAVASAAPAPASQAPPQPTVQATPRAGGPGERHRATPVARRVATELGVPLAGVVGTGPGGRIVRADVRAASTSAPAVAQVTGGRGTETLVAFTSTQRTIAARMSESRSEIPEFTVEAEIDMEAAHALRERLRAEGAQSLPSFNDVVVAAVARALREHPNLNAAYAEGGATRFSRVNVGIAVATDDALLVPTVFDADAKSLAEIAAETRRLAEAIRARAIAPDELANGTFTVSNLGMFGVRRFNAVINRPQAAILAVGEVSQRPAVGADGGLVVRRRMDVALSCDHRIVYGADGARFLQRVRELLETPDH